MKSIKDVRAQSGFTLLEALIALLVLSIGMLGVAAMQLKALQGAHAAYQRSIASLAAQDAQERLWASLAQSEDLVCPSESVVNGEDEAWDLVWSAFLPGLGADPIEGLDDCEFRVSVVWSEQRFGGTQETFSYFIRLPGE